jgi:preprotein translocase subunit SecB
MISSLQLNNYFIEELSVRGNPAYEPMGADRNAGQISCTVDMAKGIGDDDGNYRIGITVMVRPASSRPALDPYEINLRVVGFFNFLPAPDMTPEDKDRMATLNGSSILYGLARGLVAQATGVGEFGKYLLPGVNFIELLRNKTVVQPALAHQV